MRRARIAAVGVGVALGASLCGCVAPEAEPTPSATLPAAFDLDEDFPDPDVIAVDGVYTAFATGGVGYNIRVATSPDLHDWRVERRDALPTLPAWASTGRTWAPDVSAAPGGGYVMYVTAWHTASDRQCIGVATSASLDEPFTPASDEPIVCPIEQGGAIDASTFTDADGTRYLLWKTDGNCCSLDTWIELAPLSADGLTLAGEPTRLIQQTEAWEGNLVEAPVLTLHDGR
jgi:beta-xylosidase